MTTTLGVEEMGRKKTARPSRTVRIDEDVYSNALIVAGFEGKDLGEYISGTLRSIVESALLAHAQKVVDSKSGPPPQRPGRK